ARERIAQFSDLDANLPRGRVRSLFCPDRYPDSNRALDIGHSAGDCCFGAGERKQVLSLSVYNSLDQLTPNESDSLPTRAAFSYFRRLRVNLFPLAFQALWEFCEIGNRA